MGLHPATAKKRSKAIKEGDILSSKSLYSFFVVSMSIILYWAFFCIEYFWSPLVGVLKSAFSGNLLFQEVVNNNQEFQLEEGTSSLFWVLLLPLAVSFVVSVLLVIFHTTVFKAKLSFAKVFKNSLFTLEPLKKVFIYKLNKDQEVFVLGFRILRFFVEGIILLLTVYLVGKEMLKVLYLQKVSEVISILIPAVGIVFLVIFFLVAFDLMLNYFLREYRMMMDDEEIKREFKESEVSPEVRAIRTRLQYEINFANIEKMVRKAKVIVTN